MRVNETNIEFKSRAAIGKTLSKISGCKSVFSWLMPGQAHLPPLRLAQSARPTPRSCHRVFQSPRPLIHLSNQIPSHRQYHHTLLCFTPSSHHQSCDFEKQRIKWNEEENLFAPSRNVLFPCGRYVTWLTCCVSCMELYELCYIWVAWIAWVECTVLSCIDTRVAICSETS